jgi:hydrogenase maturation protease
VIPAPAPNILIAGIGNIFLGDDAFGVEVAQQLLQRSHPPHVRVRDFGIRGLDLVYALQDPCDALILVDTICRREGPPGTLYLLQPQLEQFAPGAASSPIDAHSMDPLKVLLTAAAMGLLPARIYIVGCEPATLPADFDDGQTALEMTLAVRAAIPEAVGMIDSLVEQLNGTGPSAPASSLQKETSTCPM